MTPAVRYIVAGAILLLGILLSLHPTEQTPTPAPLPPDAFTLRGKFVGPEAASDAAILSSLCEEIAQIIEWDGMQPEPRLKTGVAFDDLRVAAREARMRGVSIGGRQPKVRDAVHAYLDSAVGVAGGPVSPETRAAWVTAFRDIGRAAADAAR